MFTVNLKYKYSGAGVLLVLSHCPSQPFLPVHLHFLVTPTYCRNSFYHSHHMGLEWGDSNQKGEHPSKTDKNGYLC